METNCCELCDKPMNLGNLPCQICPCHTIKSNYNDYSHNHCWNQKQPSACGIPLEKHTQCCLCDKSYSLKAGDWEERFEETVRPFGAKGIVALVPEINSSCEFWMLHQIEKPIKDFIASELEVARKEARLELAESQERGNIPYFNMLIEKARQEGRNEAVEYIKKNWKEGETAHNAYVILDAARSHSKGE